MLLRKADLCMRFCVYLAWSTDQCLYVGMSTRGFVRVFTNRILVAHWKEIDCIHVEWCSSAGDAKSEESKAIRFLRPKYNKSQNGRRIHAPERVRDALELCNGDKLSAAKHLGISRATLYRRLSLEA
jgi:DNA-binding NtrC family response regulator